MNFSSLFNQLAGSTNEEPNRSAQFADKVPGGLVGGAVAGGLVATLLGSKSARKTAGTAAKYGGAAMLGGLAFKAYKDWQTNNSQSKQAQSPGQTASASRFHSQYEMEALSHVNGSQVPDSYEVTLIKAMIASAKADGTIDSTEQQRIAEAVDRLQLDSHSKSKVLDLFMQPISIQEIVGNLQTMEQKAEVYLASCLAIELDEASEYAHLSALSKALDLPPGLEQTLRAQARSSATAVA